MHPGRCQSAIFTEYELVTGIYCAPVGKYAKPFRGPRFGGESDARRYAWEHRMSGFYMGFAEDPMQYLARKPPDFNCENMSTMWRICAWGEIRHPSCSIV